MNMRINPQILSALLWAAAILLCAAISKNEDVIMVLITIAGIHTVLNNPKKKSQKCASKI